MCYRKMKMWVVFATEQCELSFQVTELNRLARSRKKYSQE